MLSGWVQTEQTPVEEAGRPQLRRSLTKDSKNREVAELTKDIVESHSNAHWLVDSKCFKIPVSCVVVANILQIGLSVDLRGGSWDDIWQITEYVFAGCFGLEMSIKILFLRRRYFMDGWNLLDFALAWLAIADALMMAIGADGGAANHITILRGLRLSRILRTVRLFKIFKELVILMEVVLKSLRTLAWLLVLVTLLLYMNAIICVELIGSEKTLYPAYSEESEMMESMYEEFNNFLYFGTIFRSMYSLFNLITLSEWSTITRPVSEAQPLLIILMITFTMVTSYGIMNVLIGIMVEHALKANKSFDQTKEAEYKEYQLKLINTVASILTQSDTDGDGCVTLEELETAIETNGTLATLLNKLDLPEGCTMKELFVLIDDDGDAHVQRQEFVTAMHRMIYCSEFQRLCMMQISLNTVKHLLRHLSEEIETLKENGRTGNSNGGRGNDGPVNESSEDNSKAAGEAFPATSGLHNLHAELREVRTEIGRRFADLEARLVQPPDRQFAAPPQPPTGGYGVNEPPTPHGCPPAFRCEDRDAFRHACHKARSLTEELPGMMPSRQQDHSTDEFVRAQQLHGSKQRPSVMSIVSKLEAEVGELQRSTEAEMSMRKHALECQAAMRTCCSELARACLAQEDATAKEVTEQKELPTSCVVSQARASLASERSEAFHVGTAAADNSESRTKRRDRQANCQNWFGITTDEALCTSGDMQ